jgi:hypothetical protein
MAITAGQVTTTSTLEQFRVEFNKLQTDVSGIEAGSLSFTNISATQISVAELTVTSTLSAASFIFEGTTDDDNETTFGVIDPTADRTINLPNASGTILLTATTENSFITGQTSITSGDIVSGSDELLVSDASASAFKRITVDNLISSAGGLTSVAADTTPQLGGFLDGQGNDVRDIGLLEADNLSGSYGSSSAPITITVTVASKTAAHPYNGDGSSSAYFLDGVESPALQLNGVDNTTSDSGYYYRFDQADSSNSSHPLRFYLDADKTTAYTSGVTTNGTPGNAGAYTQIDVDEDTPSILYYQCSSHGYMGNHAIVLGSNKINHTEALISFPTTTGTLIGSGDTGTLPLATIDIDGGSDIGADLTSSDLIIVDDGAGGTNKKAALSRVITLMTAQGFSSEDPTALAIALG